MPLNTGYREIDRNWKCRCFPGITRSVLSIVSAEWIATGYATGCVLAEEIEGTLRPRVLRSVHKKYSFIGWLSIALLIAEIIIKIWIARHSLEACCKY